MGLGAVLIGVFSFVCMFAGAALTPVPFVGTMLSFLSPILAIGGIVLGGVAMSRAKQVGDNDGLAIAGLVVNVVAFVPAMVVALTCGLCNTCWTGAMLAPSDPNARPFWMQDGGGSPTPFDVLFGDAGVPGSVAPPPPAFPPPPPGTAPQPGTAPPGTVQPGTAPPGTVQPGTVQPGTLQPPAPAPAPSSSAPTPQPGTGVVPSQGSGAPTAPGPGAAVPPPPLPAGPTGAATAGGLAGGGR